MAAEGLGALLSAGPLGIAAAAILLLSLLVLWARHRPALNGGGKAGPKAACAEAADEDSEAAGPPKRRAVLLYGTQTGTAERFSKQLKGELQTRYGDETAFEVSSDSPLLACLRPGTLESGAWISGLLPRRSRTWRSTSTRSAWPRRPSSSSSWPPTATASPPTTPPSSSTG